MKQKLLITGASGFLGYNLCVTARAQWDVTGISFTHETSIDTVPVVKIDLRETGAVRALLDDLKPDGLIHCAAASDPNYCQRNPEETQDINVGVPETLAQMCRERSIRFAFTSTDLVFDGTRAPYKETDPVCPVSIYGEQKVEAERRILHVNPDASVCRMALMFGNPGPVAKSFVQPFIAALNDGKELRLFTDEYRSVLGGRGAAAGLLLALERSSGIIHLGGSQRLSRYEFGMILARMLGKEKQILPFTQAQVPMPAPRPPDVSFDIAKARGLGFNPPGVAEELRELVGKK